MMNLKSQKSLKMKKMTMKKSRVLTKKIQKEFVTRNLPPENAADNLPRLLLPPSQRLAKEKLKNQEVEKRKNLTNKRQRNPPNLRKDNGIQMSNLLTNANNARVI
jgi:hypothetical protein